MLVEEFSLPCDSDFMQPADFPEHLKLQLQKQLECEDRARRQHELDLSTCKVSIRRHVRCFPWQRVPLTPLLHVLQTCAAARCLRLLFRLKIPVAGLALLQQQSPPEREIFVVKVLRQVVCSCCHHTATGLTAVSLRSYAVGLQRIDSEEL